MEETEYDLMPIAVSWEDEARAAAFALLRSVPPEKRPDLDELAVFLHKWKPGLATSLCVKVAAEALERLD
uniref:Uncharacterized protein n=1 Tax=Muribaculaceae bacterium Z82 TaxID=2304548 RepID=A0A7C9JEQ1_9BACT